MVMAPYIYLYDVNYKIQSGLITQKLNIAMSQYMSGKIYKLKKQL